MKVLIIGRIEGFDIISVRNAFKEAEILLDSEGHEIFNPLDEESFNQIPWEQFMMNQIESLFKSDALFLLNDWHQGKEAIILKTIAELHGKRLMFEPSDDEIALFHDIEEAIQKATGLQKWQYAVKARDRELFYARMLFAVHANASGVDNDVIAHRICRDKSTVSYYIDTYSNERSFNKKFATIAETVDNILRKTVSQ